MPPSPFIRKYQFILTLFLGLCVLSITQCGGAAPATPAIEKITIGVEAEDSPEIKTIATEEIPVNNCGGNSELGIDVQRKREFTYAVVDNNGFSFGAEYAILKAFLEKEYAVTDGEEETESHTLHLATKANSNVKFVIAWKETWLNGRANIVKASGVTENTSYKIKKGLTLEVQEVKDEGCK